MIFRATRRGGGRSRREGATVGERTWTRDAQDRAGGWARGAQGTAARVPTALRLAYSQASEAARQAFTEALHDQSESGGDTSAEA